MNPSSTGSAFKIPNPTVFDNLEEVINALTRLIVPVFLLTFAAMLLYGAFQWLTAKDDAGKVESAKKIMGAAIIGFVLAVLAPTIVNFVASFIISPDLGI
jgi:threonine/homoserine/homoserine lactone efflux protein